MAGRGSPAMEKGEIGFFAIGGNLMGYSALMVPNYLSYFIYSIFSSRDESLRK
jgi:hypothetical protein